MSDGWRPIPPPVQHIQINWIELLIDLVNVNKVEQVSIDRTF